MPVTYFATPSGPLVREAIQVGHLGMITTPAQGNILPAGVAWCGDNGCFGKGYPGDDAWLTWLRAYQDQSGTCAFAVAPDVLGDAAATLERSAPFLRVIRELGFPAAYVAQNGIENTTIPWDEFDVLFIGGDTPFKLGATARKLTQEANTLGKRVHMGRVNSLRRLQTARDFGCDSADGTFLAFGPDKNLPRLLSYLEQVNRQPVRGLLF